MKMEVSNSSDGSFEPEENPSSSSPEQESEPEPEPGPSQPRLPTHNDSNTIIPQPYASRSTPFEISSPVQYQRKYNPRTSPPRQTTLNQPSSPPLPQQNYQIHPTLLSNPYANPPLGEPSYFTRPNRYFGPASTWRSWTEEDRTASTSLERLRAEDLSVHLYCAYSLKRRGETRRKGKGRGKSKGKERSGSIVEDDEGDDDNREEEDDKFIPPKLWTAWPLPPDEVPREEFCKSMDVEGVGIRKSKDLRPSAVLEECLIASTTKHAREKWEGREWDDEIEELKEVNQKVTEEKSEEEGFDVSEGDQSDSEDVDSEDEGEEVVTTASIPNSSVGSSTASPRIDKANVQYFSSQAFAPPSPTASNATSSETSHITQNRKTVFTADDDQTRKLIIPSTRHIISKLDELLIAIHKSKRNYAYHQPTGSRSRSKSVDRDQLEDTQEQIENETNDIPQGRSRKRRRSTSEATKPIRTTQSRSRSISRPKVSVFQPHDWSSIIGFTSILGLFDAETIQRASVRCATLFNENMLMRTFHEETRQDMEGVEERKGPWFEENFIVQDDEVDEDHQSISSSNNEDTEEEAEVIRSSPACIACFERKRKCIPPTPIMQHDRVISCKVCLESNEECSGITWTVKKVLKHHGAFVCPQPGCKRYPQPFKKQSDLRRHLKLAHGEGILSSSPGRRRSNSSMRSSPNKIVEDIFCPIDECVRGEGKRPFKRSGDLYGHVRRLHPEVDIDKLKFERLHKHGETRGRWTDDRRHRSRSQNSRSKSRRRESSSDEFMDLN